MKPAILISCICWASYASAQCSDTSPGKASTFSDNNSIGIYDWSNPGDAMESDDQYATAKVNLASFAEGSSHYLFVTDFGFAIPSGASICGISVQLEKRYLLISGSLASIYDKSIRLVKNGNLVGNDKASNQGWQSTDSEDNYGGSGDGWGSSWTAADINSSSFGVAISVVATAGSTDLTLDAMIDHVSIIVYYNAILPVDFKEFIGKRDQDHIRLQWSTASESNSEHFMVEKTVNERWVAIDSVAAAGNSVGDRTYHSVDRFPAATNIYRIRQVDRDGHLTYSKSIRVHFNAGANITLRNYPNPVQKILTIESSAPFHSVQLTDQSGKIVLHKDLDQPSYTTLLNIANLPAGVYMLQTDVSAKEAAKRVVIYR